jgi:hypothetical protein
MRSPFRLVMLLRMYEAKWMPRALQSKIDGALVIECRQRLEPNFCLSVLISKLGLSKSADYSRLLLGLMALFPPDITEKHEELRRYFLDPRLRSGSVQEGIRVCEYALSFCFSPKA